jgi:hypothetical protein
MIDESLSLVDELGKYRCRQTTERAKLATFAHLGGVCCRCGFADPRALQIDHVAGDGQGDRRLKRSRIAWYRAVREDAAGRFQLLCANCNWIKRWENGEHLPLAERPR